MMLKRTLLHASMPDNSVLNERISCLFQDATQAAAQRPREGPQEARACPVPSCTERTQEAAGVARTNPTSPAAPASSSSQAPLQTPVPDTLDSTVAGSCRGIVVQTTGLGLHRGANPGGYTAASWAAETEQLGQQPQCQAGARRGPFWGGTGWGGELGVSDPPCQGRLVEELFPFSHYNNLLAVVQPLRHVRLSETPWTVAPQAPLSMGFSSQEDWSGLPFPPPGGLPHPGIEPMSTAFEGIFFAGESPGTPLE